MTGGRGRSKVHNAAKFCSARGFDLLTEREDDRATNGLVPE
jgi:hypothetical protein